MNGSAAVKFQVKEPKDLSPRIAWLRDYYFTGLGRRWNNEFTSWTTGTPWDVQFDEMSFYIVPETYPFLQTFRSSMHQAARPVKLHADFWTWSLPERRAWFIKEVMVNYVPQEILPGDLIAGRASTSRPPGAGPRRRPRRGISGSTGKRAPGRG